MKKGKLILGAVAVAVFLFTSVGEAMWWSSYLGEERQDVGFKAQIMDGGGRLSSSRMRKMRVEIAEPLMVEAQEEKNEEDEAWKAWRLGLELLRNLYAPELELPNAWAKMTPQMRRQYRFNNKDRWRRQFADGLEMPASWRSLSHEERKAYWEKKIHEPGENLREILINKEIEIPENWSKMNPVEHGAFLREHDLRMPKRGPWLEFD